MRFRWIVLGLIASCALQEQERAEWTPAVAHSEALIPPPGIPRAIKIDQSTAPVTVSSVCSPTADFCEQAEPMGFHGLPPVYGRGAAFVDVDNDGWDDIWQSHTKGIGFGEDRASVLWRNNADGTFSPLDLGIPEDHMMDNWSGAWADVDNDGDQDVLLVNGGYDGPGRIRLYRNDLDTLGTFTKVPPLGGLTAGRRAWWGASFADYDNDGWLDLVVAARSQYTVAPCCVGTVSPSDLPEATLKIYRNLGNGTFEDVSDTINAPRMWFDMKNPVWWDYNQDGWLDIFVSSMGSWASRNFDTDSPPPLNDTSVLLRNNQGQGFTDVSAQVCPDPHHRSAVFAASVWDFNQDGLDDLYMGRGQYQDYVAINGVNGLQFQGLSLGLDMSLGFDAQENTMGLSLGDLTGDGLPEVFVGPGWPDYAASTIVYRNNGVGVPMERMTTKLEGRFDGFHHGVATGDFDHDGDDDLFWNMGGFGLYDIGIGAIQNPGIDSRQYPMMMVNHVGAEHNTAAVRLQGNSSNRDAVGARIRVQAPGHERFYRVQNMTGFQSRNSYWHTLALGAGDKALVFVEWPNGNRTVNLVRAGARVRLIEP